jgi:hypothetical protein
MEITSFFFATLGREHFEIKKLQNQSVSKKRLT